MVMCDNENMEQKSFTPIIIIITIISVAVLTGGAWYYNRTRIASTHNNKIESIPIPTDNQFQPTVQPSPSPKSTTQADWKLHRNKEIGFEFMYPHSWSVRHGEVMGLFWIRVVDEKQENYIDMDVRENIKTLSLQEWKKTQEIFPTIDERNVTIGAVPGLRYKLRVNPEYIPVVIFSSLDNKYIFRTWATDVTGSYFVFNQILDGFKFINE